jgi:segregation and condensation protein A
MKNAAEKLDALPRYERDIFAVELSSPDVASTRPLPEVKLDELIKAFKTILKRIDMTVSHRVEREPLSIRERMTEVLSRVKGDEYTVFTHLFRQDEGRMGMVVTFIAVLELVKESLITLVQTEPYSAIHVKAV